MTRHRDRNRRATSPANVIVGVVGELLMTAGVLLALFVFWQLFWTTWQAQTTMEQGLVHFREEVAQGETPTEVAPEQIKRRDEPPVYQRADDYAIFGTIHVPKWNHMAIPLAEGTYAGGLLDLGYAGHYSDTQQPGELGNFAVAGHRQTAGHNFRDVHKLVPGDPVIVETKDAWLVYRVFSHEIVDPSEVEVVAPVPRHPEQTPTKRLMTMTTCDPEWGNSHRYIVYTEFDYWLPRDAGLPSEMGTN
ncbi:MAG: class E sortase [Buchananella hordeovulneris]|nr:class E sortase [Buchananella hordeovulneris]